MKGKQCLFMFIVLATLLLAATAYAGGWVIVTIRDLPEDVIAGNPVRIAFMARAHGVSPLGTLKPEITARCGNETVKASAIATKITGEYAATLRLPHAGKWTIELDTIFYNHSILTELNVRPVGSATPRALAPAEVGERLFAAKGCVGCHIKDGFSVDNRFDVGPNLTDKRFPESYLKSFLANPQAVLGRKTDVERGEMPNLELKQSEIAALAAFINRK